MVLIIGAMPFSGTVSEDQPQYGSILNEMAVISKYNLGTLVNYLVIFMFLVNMLFVVTSIISEKCRERRLIR